MRKAGETQSGKGFTLIELLVVIGIIAILASILIPALTRAREQARKAMCGTNLRHIGTGLRMFANDHNDSLPLQYTGWWLWDVSYYTTDYLLENGCDRKAFYCPSFKGWNQDNMILWQFSQNLNSTNPERRAVEPTDDASRQRYYRITTYFWLMDSEAGRATPITWGNTRGSVRPDEPWLRKMSVEFGSDRELVTDATLSKGPDPSVGPFTNVYDHYNPVIGPGRTNHVDGDKPVGGNIVYADTHVSWRDFSEMDWHYVLSSTMTYHWW